MLYVVENWLRKTYFIDFLTFFKIPTNSISILKNVVNSQEVTHAAGIFCVGFKSPDSKNLDYGLANKVITSFYVLRKCMVSRYLML